MGISNLFSADRILLFDPAGKAKEELIGDLFQRVVAASGLDLHVTEIQNALLERERSMSTGIGQGVAIPHCSSEHVSEVHGALALLPGGIEFQAVDDEPVRVAVLLLLPKNKFEKHIKTLAAVARMFNDQGFRERILASATPEEAAQLIAREEAKLN